MLLSLLFLLVQTETRGLKNGEVFRLATAAEIDAPHGSPLGTIEVSPSRMTKGRVVDAFTRQPIAGVTVQTWTEELNSRAAGFQKFGEQVTGRDGQYRLLRGGKGRAFAPGYVTSTSDSIDSGSTVELFPIDPRLPEAALRFVNTEGVAIEDVWLTSTLTCAHDIYAVSQRSDATGLVRLPEFGIQEQLPELRVRAAGYQGIEYLEGELSWQRQADGNPMEIMLLRMDEAIHFTLLDMKGNVAPGVPLHLWDGASYHIVRSDDQGGVHVRNRYDGNAILALSFGEDFPGEYRPMLDLIPPEHVRLRIGGAHWTELEPDLPTARITATGIPGQLSNPELESSSRVELALIHEDGWYRDVKFEELAEGLDFPSGKITLYVGGRFSFVMANEIGFVTTPNTDFSLELRELIEFHRTVQLIDFPSQMVVQHGATTDYAQVEMPVIAGQDMVFRWYEQGAEFLRRVSAAELESLVQFDPTQAGEPIYKRIDSAQAEAPLSTIEIHLPQVASDTRGRISHHLANGSHPEFNFVRDADALRVKLDGHSDAHALLGVHLRGFRPLWMRSTFPAAGQQARQTAHPMPNASIELQSEYRVHYATHAESTWLQQLDPGPIQLTVQFESDVYPDSHLELELEPGEQRVIDIDQEFRNLGILPNDSE